MQCNACGSISGVYYEVCDECVTRLNRLQAENEELLERVSKAERDIVHANELAAVAEDKLAVYCEDYIRVMKEECAGDEVHCTCVPFLRQEIERLRADNTNCRHFIRQVFEYPYSPVWMIPIARKLLKEEVENE